jgi:hypothetical protein
MSDCIPAKERTGQWAKVSNGIKIMRQTMSNMCGPRPDGKVIRHLCENDSTARNGFVCINPEHMCYATQWENIQDQLKNPNNIDMRRKMMSLNSRPECGGKVSGPIACAIEYTCPTCGKAGKGPNHLRYHGKMGEKCNHLN